MALGCPYPNWLDWELRKSIRSGRVCGIPVQLGNMSTFPVIWELGLSLWTARLDSLKHKPIASFWAASQDTTFSSEQTSTAAVELLFIIECLLWKPAGLFSVVGAATYPALLISLNSDFFGLFSE